MRLLRDQRGIALPEILVGMVISLAVFGATMTALEMFMRQSARTTRAAESQDSARSAVDRLARQLRNATSAATGTGSSTPAVEQSLPYDLVFLAPDPAGTATPTNPQGLMHVRYCLNSSTISSEVLWNQTAPYSPAQPVPSTSSCPGPTSSGAWRDKRTVASHFVNQYLTPNKPLFTTATDSSGSVTDVGVNPWVDGDPIGGAPATRLRTSVTLRNLNHAPTVPSPNCTTQNGHAFCDASAASDADGQALAFTWLVDGNGAPACAIGGASARLDVTFPGCVPSGSHTFVAVVSDTGGATTTSTPTTLALP